MDARGSDRTTVGVGHAVVYNVFNLGSHLVRAEHYRNLREGAFAQWDRALVRSE